MREGSSPSIRIYIALTAGEVFMNKSRKLYFKKSIVTHPDNLVRKLGCVYMMMNYIGEEVFEPVELLVVSKKTGNVSRRLLASVAEVQGQSGVYGMTWTDKMIRNSERVFDSKTGQEYKVKPVARVFHLGYVIYDIKAI